MLKINVLYRRIGFAYFETGEAGQKFVYTKARLTVGYDEQGAFKAVIHGPKGKRAVWNITLNELHDPLKTMSPEIRMAMVEQGVYVIQGKEWRKERERINHISLDEGYFQV